MKQSIFCQQKYKVQKLRSHFYDYSDACIVVQGRMSVKCTKANNRRNKKPAFKNNAEFTSCISKINNTFTNNAEDLDVVTPMYNLLEYSDNCSVASRRL